MASAKKQVKEYEPTPDKDPRFDGFAQVGHFARVSAGDHEGRYGVVERVDGETAVLITRDDDNDRLEVKYLDLTPASSGGR